MQNKSPFKILFVEDLQADAELAMREIEKENIEFNFRLVQTEVDFRNELHVFNPDIVVSDYSMPAFDGMSALKIVREQSAVLPFIVLTGSTNEETAVKCMKAGANDYVIKEQIKRLPFAVMEAIDKGKAMREKNEAERRLERSVHEYRDLINGMSETVWIISQEGVLLDVNNTAVEVLGFSREELLVMGILGIDAYLEEQKFNELVELMRCEKHQFFHTWHIKKSGEKIPVEVNSSRIMYGGQPAILSVARDITDRIKVEDRLRLLSRSVEESPIGVVITNRDGIIEYVNSAFRRISGYNLHELQGNSLRILKSGEHDGTFYRNLWETILKGKEWRGELVNKRKDGLRYWEEVFIAPIISNEGEITHFVSVREDISGKKEMIRELVQAKEKAEESDRLKSAFLANMSHEIRTPMNGILGFTDLLRTPDLSGEEQEKYIEIIQKSGERMLNTVNDIIEISRIETKQIVLATNKVNISNHLITLTTFFEPEFKSRGVKLIIENELSEEESLIFTDKVKVGSILTNLLKNALKFTDKGSITVGISKDRDLLQFFVRDTGIGIPEDKLDAIFDRFVQAEMNISRSYEGSGLGLSIAKSYVEMLGGEIWVESEVNKGSAFYFTIKFNPVSQQVVNKESKAQEAKTVRYYENLNLLIVEDDPNGRDLLKFIFQNNCNKIYCAENGAEAVQRVQKNPDINMIIMDLKLPVMDGYEATRRIKEINGGIKIVAQTAYTLSGDRSKALAAGCNEYIPKPINKVQLMAIVNKYFG